MLLRIRSLVSQGTTTMQPINVLVQHYQLVFCPKQWQTRNQTTESYLDQVKGDHNQLATLIGHAFVDASIKSSAA